MISLHCDSQEPEVIYGIKHFIEKYGIPIKFNEKKDSSISIVYGNSSHQNDFLIKVAEEDIDKTKILSLLHNCQDVKTNGFVKYYENQINIQIDIFKIVGHLLSGRFRKYLGCLLYTSPSPRDRG